MTRQTTSVIKGAAAGLIAGGAAFMAVKTFTSTKSPAKKAAAKAMKVIGDFMEIWN